jgi:predicted ATPase
VLVDETELEAGFIGPSDIIKIADAWRRAKNLRASCIAVVAPNVVVFGLNRMFQLVANEEERIMVFRKREDAADWLIHQTEPSPLPPK